MGEMKRKYYVIKSPTKRGFIRIIIKHKDDYVAVCSSYFKEIAGFLPKKGEMIPIDIKITKRKE